ncbi:hypothetical protein BD779DRAFT_1682138 [Infundibulicybe gibba]|nr:hypothetical protein BD779DRAFT_1682138 [Infundibulicybe gibba]
MSALSDAEYSLYTSSFADPTLTPDALHNEDSFYKHTRLGAGGLCMVSDALLGPGA